MRNSGSKGFTSSRRSAQQGFRPSWRSAQQGFESSWRSAQQGFESSWRSAQQGFESSWRSAQQGFESSWRSAQQGFTLVEVLVALVVTSLILAIVMNGALQAKTRAVGARDKERAVMLARGLIAGRAAAPYDNATRTGEESGLRWSIAEKRLATDPRGLLLLSEIDVSVRNANGAKLSELQLRKIKAAPQS